MAKISKDLYDKDSNISRSDNWVGSDAESNKRTKKYYVGDVSDFIKAEIEDENLADVLRDADTVSPVTDVNKVITEADVGDFGGGDVTQAGDNSFTGANDFALPVRLNNATLLLGQSGATLNLVRELKFPLNDSTVFLPANRDGTLALTNDFKTINGESLIGTTDIVIDGSGGDVTLAGNNTFTGINSFQNGVDFENSVTIESFDLALNGNKIKNLGDGTLSADAVNKGQLDEKQDKLSEGAFIDGDKTKLDGITAGAKPDQDISGIGINASAITSKQDTLVSTTNIKTINGTTILGSGDLIVSGGATGSDVAYDVITWDANTDVPTKNVISDLYENKTFKVDTDGALVPIVPIYWQGTQAEFTTKFGATAPDNYFTVVTDANPPATNAADIVNVPSGNLVADNVQGALDELQTEVDGLSGGLVVGDIDTLAELNAIVTDATLIDTTDARLSDARTPTAHTHVEADITDLGTYSTDIHANIIALNAVSGTNTGDQVLTGLDYEPTKGADDNYVTDAEKVVIGNTSGTNTGDVTLTTTGTSGAATLVGQALNIPNYAGGSLAVTTGTGTAIDLTNVVGAYYNIGASSTATAFTVPTVAVGGFAVVESASTTTEPTITVTGGTATEIPSLSWVVSTTMYLNIYSYDGVNVFYYWSDTVSSIDGFTASTISNASANAGLVGTEEVIINTSGVLEKTTTQDIANLGSGDVTKVGTAWENQVAIWKTDGSIEGLVGLTFDDVGTNTLNVSFGADSQGNIKIGSNSMLSSNDASVSSLFNGSLIKTGTDLAFTGNITSAGTINGATITSGTLNGSVTGTNTGDNAVNTLYSGLVSATTANVKAINDRVLEPNLTGLATYAIDYSLAETFFLAITQATSLTELNLPSSLKSKVITIHVSGNFALTYPAGWDTNITGAYAAGTGLTTITVEYVATAVPFYKVLIVQ